MGYIRAEPHTCCDDAWYTQTDISRDDDIVEATAECQNCSADWKDVFRLAHAAVDVDNSGYTHTEPQSCCEDPSYSQDSIHNKGDRVNILWTCLNCDADWKTTFSYSHSLVLTETLN